VLKTAAAEPAATAPTISVDANLVNIPVVIHDKHGALIQDLPKDQFQLWVDKKPVDIRYFNRDTNLPLTLGLIVDVSPSQREALGDERKASDAFLDTMLTAQDKAFVVQFARQIDLLQDLTGSKPELQAGLQQIGTASPNDGSDRDDSRNQTAQNGGNNGGNTGGNSGGNNTPPWARGGGNGGNRGGGNVPVVGAPRRANTVLYDALFLSADEVIGKQTGRKAIVILSNGLDHGSKESLASAIEAAQRADAIVYAIYFKGDPGKPDHSDRGFSVGDPNQCDPYGPPGGYPGSYPPYGYPGGGYPQNCTPPMGPTGSVESTDGRKFLERIATQTGGRLFELDKKTTLADIYKQISDELRAQYRLAFTPDKDASSDGYHRLDVSLKGDPKDLFVQTREGYYAGPAD
jgi:VWFA-related protein